MVVEESGDYRRELVKRLLIEEEDKGLADQLKILLDEDEPEDEE